MQDTPVRQHEVRDHVPTSDDAFDGEIGEPAIHVRQESQTGLAFPSAVDANVLKIVADELGDLGLAVDVGQKLEIDVQLAQPPAKYASDGGRLA